MAVTVEFAPLFLYFSCRCGWWVKWMERGVGAGGALSPAVSAASGKGQSDEPCSVTAEIDLDATVRQDGGDRCLPIHCTNARLWLVRK